MKIGIDISQIAHEGTGVSVYVKKLVGTIIAKHPEHEYVLFGSSLRKLDVFRKFYQAVAHGSAGVRLVTVPIPPTILAWLWNTLHIIPIEWFTGKLDVFWSSDWTQPPLAGARGITTIHDLSILRYPNESHNKTSYSAAKTTISPNIVAVQSKRLSRAMEECELFLCDSEATRKDAEELLGVPRSKLRVVYPGFH